MVQTVENRTRYPNKENRFPLTEGDLRITSLTPFISKVFERFIVKWPRMFIGHQIDPKQFGDGKGNATTHYLVELVNFILTSQNQDSPQAALLAMTDFSKAYNRQNHNIFVTKLSDMGVPGWLLNLVMGYLSEREMLIQCKGGLLEVLLFMVLVNDCGLSDSTPNENQLSLKYVDDSSVIESIDLKTQLAHNQNRQKPDNFRSRTGHISPPKSFTVIPKNPIYQ